MIDIIIVGGSLTFNAIPLQKIIDGVRRTKKRDGHLMSVQT